jgi:hypothetical protein
VAETQIGGLVVHSSAGLAMVDWDGAIGSMGDDPYDACKTVPSRAMGERLMRVEFDSSKRAGIR